MNLITSFVSQVFAMLLRAVLLLGAAVFVAGLVAVALLFALVTIAASLLLGRKPSWRASFRAPPQATWSRFRPGAAGRPAARPAGEVIDIEVRDVTPVLDAEAARRPR